MNVVNAVNSNGLRGATIKGTNRISELEFYYTMEKYLSII